MPQNKLTNLIVTLSGNIQDLQLLVSHRKIVSQMKAYCAKPHDLQRLELRRYFLFTIITILLTILDRPDIFISLTFHFLNHPEYFQ